MPGFGSVSWGGLFSWSGLIIYSGKYLSCDSMLYPDLSAALLFQTEHLLMAEILSVPVIKLLTVCDCISFHFFFSESLGLSVACI